MLNDEYERVRRGRPERMSENQWLHKLGEVENKRMQSGRSSRQVEDYEIDCSLDSIFDSDIPTNISYEQAKNEIVDSMLDLCPDLALRIRGNR